MEFSSTELFVEILIAGTLFALGLSPLILFLAGHLFPEARKEQGHQATAAEIGGVFEVKEWKDLKPWIVAAVTIALVYSLGVAGNRLIEELYKKIGISAEMFSKDICGISKPKTAEEGATKCAEIERRVRNRNEFSRDWVERHKSYRKILRAGSAASAIFLLSTLVYRGKRKRGATDSDAVHFRLSEGRRGIFVDADGKVYEMVLVAVPEAADALPAGEMIYRSRDMLYLLKDQNKINESRQKAEARRMPGLCENWICYGRIAALAIFVFFTVIYWREDVHFKSDLLKYCEDIHCMDGRPSPAE